MGLNKKICVLQPNVHLDMVQMQLLTLAVSNARLVVKYVPTRATVNVQKLWMDIF
jgi:hypothetical protein